MSKQKRKKREIKYDITVTCTTGFMEKHIHDMLLLTVFSLNQFFENTGKTANKISINKH